MNSKRSLPLSLIHPNDIEKTRHNSNSHSTKLLLPTPTTTKLKPYHSSHDAHPPKKKINSARQSMEKKSTPRLSSKSMKAAIKKSIKQDQSQSNINSKPTSIPQKPQKTDRNQMSNQQKIQRIRSEFLRIMGEWELKENSHLNISQFFQAFNLIKGPFSSKDLIPVQEILLALWKSLGGFENKWVPAAIVYICLLESSSLLDYNNHITNFCTENVVNIFKSLRQRFKKQGVSQILLNQYVANTSSNLKKKQSQTSQSSRARSKSRGSPGDSMLDVTVKIKEGVIQRISVKNKESVSLVADILAIKHKLSKEKVELIKTLIYSQLNKHLTRITEESIDDCVSEISDTFNQL